MIMKAFFTIAETNFVAEIEYKITAEAYGPTGPSYACGGDPGSPMEFEITLKSICEDIPGKEPVFLEIPGWLEALIEEHLSES
jgi:hypothetical protein